LDLILDSVNDNWGVVTVNQASGNNNNQGSALTAAVDDYTPPPPVPEPGLGGYAEAQAAVDQKNGVEKVEPGQFGPDRNIVDSANIIFREGHIIDSINDNIGLVMVNQATGQMNNQANNVAVAISLDPSGGVALSEADLGQETSNNFSHESEADKFAMLTGSVNNNTGVTLVNQGVGNMTNQANVLSVGAVAVGGNL
jgi:hypothetical protein